MAHPTEILFIDPVVADVETILGNLRPEVQAIVLDRRWPAARQMAAALEGRKELDAVHVIAHGAPGRVCFAGGDWSAETLETEAEDFFAIGEALGANGDLRLWSCETARGETGDAFIEVLAKAVGADVSAATTRVGGRGARWRVESGRFRE
jgi:hypothetical protein